MKILLRNCKVIYPDHPLHNKTINIVVEKGRFTHLSSKKPKDNPDQVIDKAMISPGWVDVGTTLSEPGYEHRDTADLTLSAAASGGFTDVIGMPGTKPVIDNATSLMAIQQMYNHHPVTLHLTGAINQNLKDVHLAEMGEMKNRGAVAFTNGPSGNQASGNLKRALEYTSSLGTLVINQPQDGSVISNWQMHEGDYNIQLGMVGHPAFVEEAAVTRDIYINDYTGGQLLVHLVSNPDAIKHTASYKGQGDVYTSISFLNLVLNDSALIDFDSRFKVNPPLRSEIMRKQLLKQINKGQIDIICSNHRALDQEAKQLEFEYASFGALGLQAFFPAINTFAQDIDLETFVKCVSINPRRIFKIDLPKFELGESAIATVFSQEQSTLLSSTSLKSLSRNEPFLDQNLKGKIMGIFAKNKWISNN